MSIALEHDQFQERSASELGILLYHGVTVTESRGIENFSRKHLTREEFLNQMSFIKRHCYVLSMDKVIAFLAARVAFPPRAVAVTFDDGFANNAEVAVPILHDLGIPATFYISTGFVDSRTMFWVDAIEDCINRTQRLSIVLPGFSVPFDLAGPQAKMAAVTQIKRRCKSVPSQNAEEILMALEETTGVTPDIGACDNYRKITWRQLEQMSADPLFAIGGHSHSHCILSQVPAARLAAELDESLHVLGKRLNQTIVHYSYPEGQPEHYNDEVIAQLKGRGIVCSPSAVFGLNPPGSDPFHLKRIMVGFMGIPFPYAEL